MTLAQLSPYYQESADLIGTRLKELRAARHQTENEAYQKSLDRRILELKPIYTECRELARLTAHYYDRSFYRNAKYSL